MTVSHLSDVTLLRRYYKILPAGVIPKVEKHFAACVSCQTRWKALEESWSIFDQWQVPPPDPNTIQTNIQAVVTTPLVRKNAPPRRTFPTETHDNDPKGSSEEIFTSTQSWYRAISPIGRIALLLSAFLFALLLGVGGGLWLYANSRTIETVIDVVAPMTIAPNEPSITLLSLQGKNQDALANLPVSLELRERGKAIKTFSQKTNEFGAARLPFQIPTPGEYTLAVRTNAPDNQQSLLFPISVRENPKLSLEIFGTPVYQGNTVDLRIRLLQSAQGLPKEGTPVTVEIFEPSGIRVARIEEITDSWGLTTISFPISPWARTGGWKLLVSSRSTRIEGSFDVLPREHSRFHIETSFSFNEGQVDIDVNALDNYSNPITGRVFLGHIQEKSPREETELIEGKAHFSFSLENEIPLFWIEVEDEEQYTKRIEIFPKETTLLSFVPVGGAFHEKLPPQAFIRATQGMDAVSDVELSVWFDDQEIARGKTGPDGILPVELPAKILNKPLRVKGPDYSFLVPAPNVLAGPIVQCEQSLLTLGEVLQCQVFHPDPTKNALLISREGYLLDSVFLSESKEVRKIEIPMQHPGTVSIHFPEQIGRWANVLVTQKKDLRLEMAPEDVAQPEEDLPVSLQVFDFEKQNQEALAMFYLQGTQDFASQYLLQNSSSFLSKNPSSLQLQKHSTFRKSQDEIQKMRYRILLLLRWGALVLAGLLLFPLFLYAFAKKRVFLITLLPFFLAPVAFFYPTWSVWITFLVFLIGCFVGVTGQNHTSLPKGILGLGLLGLFGIALITLWALPKTVTLHESKNSSQQSKQQDFGVTFPENASLTTPVFLTTDQTGSLRANLKMPQYIGKLLLLVDAFATNGGAGKTQQTIALSPDLEIKAFFPKEMTQGDTLSIPVLVDNYENTPITVQVAMAKNSLLEVQGPRLRFDVPAKGRAKNVLQVRALSTGNTQITLSASADPLLPAFTEEKVQVRPAQYQEVQISTGIVQEESILPLSNSIETIKLTMFPSYLGAIFLDSPLEADPLNCTVSLAVQMEIEALLSSRFSREVSLLSRRMQRILQSLSALETSEGGFSNCGEETFSPIASAIALVGMQDASIITHIDPELFSRTRSQLATWLETEKNETNSLLFVAWSLATAQGLASPETQKTLQRFAKKVLSKNPEELPGYTLAISTALWITLGMENEARLYEDALRKRLEDTEGLFRADEETPGGATGLDADMEASAFALLALENTLESVQNLQKTLYQNHSKNPIALALITRASLRGQKPQTPSEVSVFWGNRLITTTTIEDDNATPIDLTPYAKRNPKELRIQTTEGSLFYRIESTSKASEPETLQSISSFSVNWPTNASVGEKIPVLFTFKGEIPDEPLQCILPIPSQLAIDHSSLRKLVLEGVITRFSISSGKLILSILKNSNEKTLQLRFQAKAVRSGKSSIPPAVAFPLSLPSQKSLSTPSTLEVETPDN